MMISRTKNKNKLLKVMPNKVSTLPTSVVNSNNSNNSGTGGGANNATNAGGTGVNNSNWMTVQMYFPWYVPPTMPQEIKSQPTTDGRDGLDCRVCKEFYQYAESNQDDGTLICFKCRNGY